MKAFREQCIDGITANEDVDAHNLEVTIGIVTALNPILGHHVGDELAKESMETGKPLPENIQKLMDFMDDTGGDLSDYVKLNQDYSKLDDQSLLHEYYKQTKPHLDNEEINFLMEDTFSYDEDVDDDRDIRRKKLALKEQVASAKSHLDGQKSKYYEEIKAGSKLTGEQQKAVDFFNREHARRCSFSFYKRRDSFNQFLFL